MIRQPVPLFENRDPRPEREVKLFTIQLQRPAAMSSGSESGSESAGEAPATAVDFVQIRGLTAKPVVMARVLRGDEYAAFCVRTQLVAAGFATEREIREAAEQEQQGLTETTAEELQALKALALEQGGLASRTSRTTLVSLSWFVSRFAGRPGLDMLLARFLFNGCVQLPAQLPEEEEPLSDDEDFDASTEAEGG